MTNETAPDILQLVLIASRKNKDQLLTALSEKGGHIIKIFYGKGSVKASFLMDSFGLVPDEQKVLIMCLVTHEEADTIFDMLVTEFHFNEPNTGIAYTIPVEKLSY